MKDIIIKSQDVISQKEACKLLGISLTQLRRFAKEKHIRFVKDRANLKSTFVLKADVDNFIANRFYIV